MSHPIRAIYENGTLRLLDTVEFKDGEQVLIQVLPIRELRRVALGSAVVQDITQPDTEQSEHTRTLMEKVIAETREISLSPSAYLVEERREVR